MFRRRLPVAVLMLCAVAACGGGSTAPSPSPAPSVLPSGTANNTAYNFNGTGAAGTATFSSAAGGTLSAGPYAGLTLASTWGSITNFTTAVAMQAWLASGSGDISATTTIAFPPFATTAHQDTNGGTLSGTPNLLGYIKLQATPETTFAQSPGFTLAVAAPASVTGTSCFIYSLSNTGTGSAIVFVWRQVIPAATVSATQVTFGAQTLPAGQTVDVGNVTAQQTTGSGPTYLAVACS